MKAILFDMDGVIFDSEKLCLECWQPVAEKYNIPDINTAAYKCIGTTRTATYQILRDFYGADFPAERYYQLMLDAFYAQAENGKLPLKPFVKEILEYIRENKIPVAIASSTKTDIVKMELEAAGIIHYFDAVVGGDMAENSKPAPDIFLKAAEKLQVVPADCIVAEDSYNGIRAAKNAGMTAVMIPDILQPDEEMLQLADYICPDLAAFRLIIDKTFDII